MTQIILLILAIIIIAFLLTKKGRELLARIFSRAPKNLEVENLELEAEKAGDKKQTNWSAEKEKQEKEEKLRKIMEFFQNRERIANNDVENLLNVGDSTATRYLDELEKRNLIKQVGRTGRFVYYEKLGGE